MFAATEVLVAARRGFLPDAAAIKLTPFASVQVGALVAACTHFEEAPDTDRWSSLSAASDAFGVYGLREDIVPCDERSEAWAKLSQVVWRSRPLPDAQLTKALGLFPRASEPETFWCGFFLMACFLGRLASGDEARLTKAMLASGDQIDLRPRYTDLGYALVRRYPTGGLSEKLALIMPAVFGLLSDKFRIKSPFFVAKSLSFTGGSWDKYASIPGFRFPEGDDEICACMDAAGSAILVTHEGVNPADEALYQLRSLSCTVESKPLIVSSIASKHLAVPADVVLLDVRTGGGAFLNTRDEAVDVGEAICAELRAAGMLSFLSIRENEQPNGSAVGNYLEVLESLELITGRSTGRHDPRGIAEQKLICIDYVQKILAAARPESASEVDGVGHLIERAIEDGTLARCYQNFLTAHGVAASDIEQLFEDGEALLRRQIRQEIVAPSTGQLMAIDQKRVGYAANAILGAGGNAYGGDRDLYAGVRIRRRLYDVVRKGDVLCEVIGAPARVAAALDTLRSAFAISLF